MADINTLYASLLAADEARDAAALTAVAWQIYGQLATTAADLGGLRARFRVYAAAPHASGWPHEQPRPTPARNGPNQDIAASPRLRLGASQPSPTNGPNEGHRCWPRQDNSCLPAAGLPAPPASSIVLTWQKGIVSQVTPIAYITVK
jgi:hypothetical protein